MKLTALEIKQQTFDKAIRGYDMGEVQAFLNLVSNEWEHLVARNRDLEQKLDKMQDKLSHYERVESTLHETLQTAKESAEHKLEGAKSESRNIIERAEMEADAILRDAARERRQIRQSILSLLDQREQVISGIRSYLDIARNTLDTFTEDEARLFTRPVVGEGGTRSGESSTGSSSADGDRNLAEASSDDAYDAERLIASSEGSEGGNAPSSAGRDGSAYGDSGIRESGSGQSEDGEPEFGSSTFGEPADAESSVSSDRDGEGDDGSQIQDGLQQQKKARSADRKSTDTDVDMDDILDQLD